jgi:hypothetical protein
MDDDMMTRTLFVTEPDEDLAPLSEWTKSQRFQDRWFIQYEGTETANTAAEQIAEFKAYRAKKYQATNA